MRMRISLKSNICSENEASWWGMDAKKESKKSGQKSGGKSGQKKGSKIGRKIGGKNERN